MSIDLTLWEADFGSRLFLTLNFTCKDIEMEKEFLPFWQRSIATFIAMIAVSLLVGYIWRAFLSIDLPEYISGVVGGLTAVPLWEFLKRVRPKR